MVDVGPWVPTLFPMPAVLSSVVPVPNTSLIRPDDSAIRRLKAFSSAVETLARCFFSGLPNNPSAASVADGANSDGSVTFGGVVERSVAGVGPEAGVSVSTLPVNGSAECWRLSCEHG